MFSRLLAFVAIAASFIPSSFAQQGSIQGQGSVVGNGQIVVGPPAIPPTVTISPSTANLATSATQQFTATVLNDNFNQGVTWTLAGAGCSGTTCGTLSQPISKTGVPITYTAPSSAPTPNLVVLTATSNLNPIPASSASVNITITAAPPPIVVRNTCVPGSQTTAATNTFNCQASLGNAVEVQIYDGPTSTVTGVSVITAAGGSIALTQVCSPTNVCVATSGGVSIQKWYGIGLPAGNVQYVVSNSPAASLTGIAVIDLSNIIALDTAAFTGSVTVPTTGPIGPVVTTTAADIVIPSIGVTGSTTAIASPFTFVPGVVFGNGLAYTISPTAGTFTPNWTTTSGTWAGATSAYIGGVPTPVISVSVAPTTASVKVNTTAAFTATVTNDSQGVNWTLTGSGCPGATCGTLSSSSSASGVAITYTAPATVSSPATVTLMAASITNPAKTASATITVTANPIVVNVSPGTATVQTSATQTFSCAVTNDAANAGCDWTLTGGGCSGSTCGTLSTAHTASGVNLTYTGPATTPSPATVTITAASTTDNTKTDTSAITVVPAPVIAVAVSPGSASVQTTQVQAFSCTVTNDAGAAGCDWTLTGAGCSGSTCGTLSTTHTASGVTLNYTAPSSVPSPATVTITAASTTDNTKTSAATITVTAPPPIIISVSPGSASVQVSNTKTFSCTLTNDGGAAGCDWALTGAGCSGSTCGTLSTTHTASGVTLTYTAPGSVPSPATVTLTADSTTDPTKTAAATITVTAAPPPLTVSISPGTASVALGLTQAFTPTVVNDGSNLGVDWTLTGSGCSGATCGTLSATHTASGTPTTYTAPATVPSPATVIIHATSTTDNTKSATSTITVFAPAIVVSISPGSASVQNGHSAGFTPTVTNDGTNAGVDWTLTGSGCSGATCGTLSSSHTASGVTTTYTAPVVVPSPATVTIHATSTADNTKSATATITVFSLAITVSVAPGTATVPVNATQAFTPTVTNDAANAGVDWTLTGSCTTYSQNFSGGALPSGWAATTATGVEGGGSFSPAHISFSQGVMQMNVTQDGTTAGSVGAEVEYNQLFGYGTYSWSMQAAGTSATQGGSGSAVSGQISSTFQYSGGNPSPTEIDSPEIEGQFPTQIEWTTWLNGIRSDFHQTTLANPQNTYHIYKYVWQPGSIAFSLDGSLIWTSTTNVPTAPAHPIANLWGTNSASFGGVATPGVTRYMYINAFSYSNCGSLSASHTASGTPVTYTAPAIVPSPATVTITATSTTDNTKSASSTITVGTPPNISVAVAPATASVTTGGVANFTATVSNDTSMLGVAWALSGAGCSGTTCGSVSPAASASGVAVTYTAPSSVPSPATVTITATSVTAPTKTATATITVTSPVITVTVAPTTATLQVGGQTQAFTATVANSASGVNWTLSGSTCTGAACGTLSATTSASGVPITYTSPTANVSETVTLTATSIADGTKTATATIHVNANTTQFSCAGVPCPAFPGAQGGGAATVGGRGGLVYEITCTADGVGACGGPIPCNGATCGGTQTATTGYTNASLRDCFVQAMGARTCIFRVAGIFQVTAGDMRTFNPFVTVAGQSAPGEVIIGGPQTGGALGGISTHDVILRYLTYSPDNINTTTGPAGGTTGIWIVNCSSIWGPLPPAPPSTTGCYNIINDHATTRWAGNKPWITTSNFTPTAGTGTPGTTCSGSASCGVGPNHNITSQWTFDYEPEQGHPVGWGTATDEACVSTLAHGGCLSAYESNVDFHHNMLFNVGHRIPETINVTQRWTNNIVYNWAFYANEFLGAMTVDVINNKYITGNLNALGAQTAPVHVTCSDAEVPAHGSQCASGTAASPGPELSGPPSIYISGNITGPPGTNTVFSNQLSASMLQMITGENGSELGAVNNAYVRSSPMAASNAFPIIADPATSLDTILLPTVGNSQHLDQNGNWVSHRDAADQRLIAQYQNGSAGGHWPNGVTYEGICYIPPNPSPCPATCGSGCLPQPVVQAPWQDAPVTNFPVPVESLHDGIPDAWKTLYGLSTTSTTLYKAVDPVTGLTYLEDYLDGLKPGGGSATPLLKTLTPTQKNVSQAGIDWTQTGLPAGVPSGSWTQCGSTILAATFGNGATDATSAINSAISACGTNQFVLLGAGTFLFNSSGSGSPQILIHKSNVVLRGTAPAGASATILNSTGTNGACESTPCEGWIALGTNANPNVANDVAITGGATAGSTSITVASATNFAVGDLVVITELNDTTYVSAPPPNPTPGDASGCGYCDVLWSGTRDRSQIVEVTSVNGTTIGISPPLYTAYTLTPHALPYVPIRNSGVENLQIVGNNTHPNGNNGATGQIVLSGCAYCWVQGVEFNYPDGDYLMTTWTFRSDITTNYMTNGFNHITGTNNNAIHLTDKSSANRVYNNIIERGQNAYQYDVGVSGNVYSYNYDTGDFGAPTTVRNITGLYSHGAHGQFQLFEGNISAFNDWDVLHGSQSENTSFRDWWIGTSFICNPQNDTRGTVSGCAWGTGDPTGIFVGSLATTQNIIGDVVGSVAQTALGGAVAVLQWPSTRGYTTPYGVTWGYSTGGDSGSNSFDSAAAFTSGFVHGLYNNVNGSTTYAAGVSQTLPSSLYLTAKPAFFCGSEPWPPIGPDVTSGSLVSGQGAGASPGGHVNSIPAMVRFYTGMGGAEGGAGSPLTTFNPGTCY